MSLTYDLSEMQAQAQMHQWFLVHEAEGLRGAQNNQFMFIL